MRIAVVDDEEQTREEIRSVLERFCRPEHAELSAEYYPGGGLLLYDLQEQKTFDVYLLDIEMEGMDGLTLAARIREAQKGAYIVFLTAHPEFALEGYEVQACQYILKEQMREKLPRVLDGLYRDMQEEREAYLTIETSSRYEKLCCRDICCIRKEGKYAVFFMQEGSSTARMTLQEIYEKLPEGEFLYADRGCIVSIRSIKKYEGRRLLLVNGETVSVSRSHMAQVKTEIGKYWRNRI